MKVTKLGGFAVGAVLVVAACSGGGATTAPSAAAPSAAASKGTLVIGTELPMSGGETANGEPTANGVKLFIKQQNAKGGIGGYTLEINVQDDAVNGVHDPQQGAKNMQTLVAEPKVIGVVGPYNSGVAQAEIPISNEAGLLMCSPANTAVEVTQPPEGDKYRAAHPDKISYIRTASPDNIQGPAGADFMFNDLGIKSVYVLDDTETFGVGVGNTFEQEFKKLGGTVVKRDSAPKSTTDYTPLFTAVAGQKPAGVYLAGTTPSGMGLALKQGRTVPGFESIQFFGPDGTTDLTPGGTKGATITIAGPAAHDLSGTVGAIHDIPDPKAFADAYTAEFGSAPAAYSAPAYACAQIIAASLEKAIAAGAADPAALREGVRANAVTTTNKFDTIMGTLSFDKYGDNTNPYMSFYKVDLTAAGGKGDWVFIKQQQFTNPNAP
jgi:branched-chain amino acid transport system substrate-binding protein